MKTLKIILLLAIILITEISFSQTGNTLPLTGDVGVGTTAPSAKLEVVGDTKLGGRVDIDSSVVVRDSVTIEKKLIVDQDVLIKGTSVFVGDGKFKADLKVLGVAKMMDNLVVDSTVVMNSDAKIFGDLKIKSLENLSLTDSRLLSILPNGKVGISNLTVPQDDTYVCNIVTPWAFADGTFTDDDILLCPNFKSVTIGGALTVNGNTKLSTTGIGIAPTNQNQLNIRSVGKPIGINLLTVSSSNTIAEYGIKNNVTNDKIIAYSVTKTPTNEDVFVVMGDGRVGIGTGTPTQKLEVAHDDGVGISGGMALTNLSTTNKNSEIKFNQGATTLWAIGNDVTHNNSQDFFIFDNVAFQTRFLIDADGRVGIGVSPPTTSNLYKLYVEGGIAARDVRVTALAFPDYVFAADYHLTPLTELEQFISKNHHLPHIQSAKEVEKNEGFEIGELQIKLLKTVEEQTLYIIDLQKQLNELKKKINELSTK